MTLATHPDDSDLRALKDAYEAAHLAYKSAASAFSEATVSATDVWDRLLEAEAVALRNLNETRATFLAALTRMSKRETS